MKEPPKSPSVRSDSDGEEGSVFAVVCSAFSERLASLKRSQPSLLQVFLSRERLFLTWKSLPARERPRYSPGTEVRRCSHAESSPGDGRSAGAQPRHFNPTLVAGAKAVGAIRLRNRGIIPRLREWIKVFTNFSRGWEAGGGGPGAAGEARGAACRARAAAPASPHCSRPRWEGAGGSRSRPSARCRLRGQPRAGRARPSPASPPPAPRPGRNPKS